jgi:ribosomal protein S18 acetylase RimI-like enzyme
MSSGGGARLREGGASGVIRRAEARDLPDMGRLAGALVRDHHAADPGRFMLVPGVEQGYERWFARELPRKGAVLLVAELGGSVVGYAYGAFEERDWNMLLDEHAALHDVLVTPEARKAGLGRKLVDAMVAAFEAGGARRIVLSTRVDNGAAQHLFKRCGFRPTMLEMTRGEAAPSSAPPLERPSATELAELVEFVRARTYAVEATGSADGAPQAAVVGVAATDALELVFDTLETTRKCQNLRRDPRVALVIGWDDERTLQLEGIADEPTGAELARLQKVYFARFPDGPARTAWPGITYVRVRPTWLRFSDFRESPPVIRERTLE